MKRASWIGLVLGLVALPAALVLGNVVLAQSAPVPTTLAGTGGPAAAIVPGTAFTYQGELKDNNLPATGTYTMTFRLWDSGTGGSPVGGPNTQTVGVKSRLFSVLLDFGITPFNGQRLWLEVTISGVPLSQRQELTPAPYAITAYNGVPAGYMLAGASPTPPAGFVYTGLRVSTGIDAWHVRGFLSVARSYLGAATLGGKIYSVGGRDSSNAILNSAEAYDPATNQSTGIAPMQTARFTLAVASAGGKLYALGGVASMGGAALDLVEEYDPGANAWIYRAPLPTGRMSLSAAAWNGQIYAFGGTNGPTTYAVTEMFNPVANTWATKSPVPTSEAVRSAATLGNKIYVLTTASLFEYDPVADTWLAKTPPVTPSGRYAVAASQGKLYAIGGAPNVQVYDPPSDAWTFGPSLTVPRVSLGAASLNGAIYALGGYSSGGQADYTIEEYVLPAVFYLHQKQ